MDKQPVGQLPDLTQSNNDDEIMVITDSEHNQLKKEKISDFITDLTSTDANNALIKGTDNKLFVKNYGNADNITEGTINSDLLPESGVTAGTYTTPTNLQVNSKGQITSISEGTASGISQEDIDTVAARPLSDNACTQENFPDEFNYWYNQKYTTFNKDYISTIGTPTMSEFGVISNCGDYSYFQTPSIDVTTADSWELRFKVKADYRTIPQNDIGVFGSSWLNVFLTTTKKITATVNYSGGSLTLTSSDTYNDNNEIFGKIRYDSTGYKLYTSLNPFDYGTAATNSQTAKAASAQPLKLGNVSATSYLSQGSIDMKYFEFDINGQNVQNYKQTGVEHIVPQDITNIGGVTISTDGIASGFDTSKYLIKYIPDFFDMGFEFYISFTPQTVTPSAVETLLSFGNNTSNVLSIKQSTDGRIYTDGSLVGNNNPRTIIDSLVVGEEYNIRIRHTGRMFFGELLQDDEWVNKWEAFISGTINRIYIGTDPSLQAPLTQGSINLNKVLLDINGEYYWSPMLRVPYTATQEGTKIVDVKYLDNVKLAQHATGQALYLTLDEQNQAYYLPQGTVSGMISQNKQKIDELDTTLTADILQAMPVGASIAYEGTTAPDGWFAESGAEILQSAYPLLYAVVGDKYNLETTQEGYFRLPDTNISSRFYEGSTTPGTLTDAGLPNITGQFQNNGHMRNGGQCSGAFYQTQSNGLPSNQGGQNDGGAYGFQASRSSSIYGKSSTVQPKSITKFFIIKHD